MSSYPPPNSNYSIYNSINFTYATDSITLETADSRYLKLTGGIELGSVSFSAGLSSVGPITISNSAASTSSITGAIQSAGGAYFGNSSIVNSQLSIIGTGTASTLTGLKLNSYDTVNSYIQNNIQNLSSGTLASSDWIATCNNGNDTAGYINMGINSSGYTTALGGPSDSYLFCVADLSSNGGNLWIGTQSAKSVYLFANTAIPTSSTAIAWDGTNLNMPTGSQINAVKQKVGSTGTVLNRIEQGSASITNTTLGVDTTLSQVVNFTNSFSSTPNVVVSINSTGGTNQQKLIISTSSVSTSGFTCNLHNTGSGSATGNVNISYIAMN